MQPEQPENPIGEPDPADQTGKIRSLLSKHHAESDLWDFDFDETQPKAPKKESSIAGFAIPPAPSADPSQPPLQKHHVARPKEETSFPPEDLSQLPVPLKRKKKGPIPPRELKNIPTNTDDWIHRFHDEIEGAWRDLDTRSGRSITPPRSPLSTDPQPVPSADEIFAGVNKPRETPAISVSEPTAEPVSSSPKPAPAPAVPTPLPSESTPGSAATLPAQAEAITSEPEDAPYPVSNAPSAKREKSSRLEPEIPEPKPAPPGAPLIPRVHLHLNHFERIGILAVAIIIALAGVYGLVRFFKDIPTQKAGDLRPSFPVKGDLICIQSARTFWREPIRSGPETDKARRETRLIPVLELTLSGSGNGAIRVIFRDNQGTSIGDSITLRVSNGVWADCGQPTIRFSSTAGFDNDGMYNEYRTGGTKPWRAEILEGPSPEAPRSQFKQICNVAISTERR